jgi:aryl-alcohol dehydrogenase-like predicted oxidoreductase
MQMRRLGSDGPLVSELALGTMVFGEGGDRGTSAADASRMIGRYLDAGGNHLDTANVYAGGRSEEIVGAAISGRRDEVVLATKVRFRAGDDPDDEGLSAAQIHRAVEASLRRLGTDRIDVLYFHAWDPWVPLEVSLDAVAQLVAAGTVGHLGVSNFKAWQLMKGLALSEAADAPRFVAAQYQYSLVVRDIEREFIDLCESESVGMVPWGPLGGGFLSGKYTSGGRPTAGRIATQPDGDEEAWERRNTERNWRVVEAVGSIAAEVGATTSQVALAWLLGRRSVSSVILGVRTPGQLDDNLGALSIDLDEDMVAQLDAVSVPEEAYPYRFIEAYASR